MTTRQHCQARVTGNSEEGGEDGPSRPETRTYCSAALSPSGTSPRTRGGGWLRTPAPSPGGPGASLHSSGLQPHILLPVTPEYSLHSESFMDARLPRRGERERSFSPRILRARLGPYPTAGRKPLQTLSTWGWPLPASQPSCLSPKQSYKDRHPDKGGSRSRNLSARWEESSPGPGV